MEENLFRGKLVRLAADEPEALAKQFARWNRDSEYGRLLNTDSSPLWSEKKIKEWIEKDLSSELKNELFFNIHALENDLPIGFIGLFGINWVQGDCLVAIGIGEREYWGKGYGTDAMRLMLHYSFTELNLHRVSLMVFEYNSRAVRSYEKVGFQVEGRQRSMINRGGARYDTIFMSVLQQDWEKLPPL